jgi:hypothetical protein
MAAAKMGKEKKYPAISVFSRYNYSFILLAQL